MAYWDALIPVSAVVFGVLAAFAVTRLERRSDELKQWKVLLAAICGASLAGGSAAEFTTSNFGANAEKHPVLTSALAGAALLGITVLVIDSLLKAIAANAWEGSLKDTWETAVKGGRRLADDLGRELRGEAVNVTAADLPSPKNPRAKRAYEVAHRMSESLGNRVARASLAAFAADKPELAESMQQLASAADTLQRGLERYSTGTTRHTGHPRTREDIERMWRDYVWWLLQVDGQGRHQGFSSELSELRGWLEEEKALRDPSAAG